MAKRKPLDPTTLDACITAFYGAEKLSPRGKVEVVIDAYEQAKRLERLQARALKPAKRTKR